MSAMTIGSLFSGIGGLELGLERGIGNGAHTVWQVEQNEYCRAVLAKHWPDATRYEDVRDVGRSNLAPVDVICGGFPCQDISLAGDGAGLAGERSGLWFEYARIIRELRPRYVVVENVRALLVRGIDTVLGTLADCGYDAEWSVVAAADVGAPHQRDRLFIVAYTDHGLRRPDGRGVVGSEGAGEGEARSGRLRRGMRSPEHDGSAASRAMVNAISINGGSRGARGSDSTGPRQPFAIGPLQDIPDAEARRDGRWQSRLQESERTGRSGAHHGGRARGDAQRSWWSVEPGMGRLADGVPARVDRLRALGNAVVPQVAEVVGRLIAEREASQCAA